MPRQRIDPKALRRTAAAIADAEGLDELTLAKVAEQMGVQSSALYNHVDGADGLRHAVAVEATANLATALRDAAVGRSGVDAIRAVAAEYRAFARSHPGQYAAALLPPTGVDDELATVMHAVIDTFARILRGMGSEGDDAIHRARAVRSTVHGFVALEATEALTFPTDTDASFQHVLDFIARGLED
jgi:AcrR family transcriptional regulator